MTPIAVVVDDRLLEDVLMLHDAGVEFDVARVWVAGRQRVGLAEAGEMLEEAEAATSVKLVRV